MIRLLGTLKDYMSFSLCIRIKFKLASKSSEIKVEYVLKDEEHRLEQDPLLKLATRKQEGSRKYSRCDHINISHSMPTFNDRMSLPSFSSQITFTHNRNHTVEEWKQQAKLVVFLVCNII